MDRKIQIKEIAPPKASFTACIPLRIACLIMGYMTLFYTSLLCLCLLGVLGWMIIEAGDKIVPRGYDLGDFLMGHILSLLIFVMLLNFFAMVLTIVCLVGIHKRQPQLMIWHISFTTARMLVVAATLGYNVLAQSNFTILVAQLTDICITIYYIYVFKSYMEQLREEVANETNKNCDQSEDIKKVPIV